MLKYYHIIKGLHPGFYINRELEKRKLRKSDFARSLNVSVNIISNLTRGRRKLDQELALKIENQLGLENNSLMFLQQYYTNKLQSKNRQRVPDMSILRPVIFWDTRLESIDWEKQKNAVIRRVFERGNDLEKSEIIRFYGAEKDD
jgi:antitoxin HigA-1